MSFGFDQELKATLLLSEKRFTGSLEMSSGMLVIRLFAMEPKRGASETLSLFDKSDHN